MTRGKYAARAAQGRADTATTRADRAAQALAAEREQHAEIVAGLKATIESLSAQLTGAVTDLAAEKVRQAEIKCAEQIRAERAEFRTKALAGFSAVARVVSADPGFAQGCMLHASVPHLYGALAEALGIPAGEAQEAAIRSAGAGSTPRATRRAGAKRFQNQKAGEQYVLVGGPEAQEEQ